MSINALAVIAVRNEASHLTRQLQQLAADGLEIAVLDNGSTDGSRDIAQQALGGAVTQLVDLPWTGAFSLSDQLRAKATLIEASKHDWILHVDADEWLQSRTPGQRLLKGLAEAEAAGANCVNFDEFVFVPLPGEDFTGTNYTQQMRHYYFFQPKYPRLMRAWKRTDNLSSLSTGGHELKGSKVRKFKTDFILRHYIALSEAHAAQKYVGRSFADEDRQRGWHGNRLGLTQAQLCIRSMDPIRQLPEPGSRDFDRSNPQKLHFWDW